MSSVIDYTLISFCYRQNGSDNMSGLVDHATMRGMNLSLILRTLFQHAPISRAQLATLTGLHKASISGMVRELVADGFVKELPISTESSGVGRPAISLELNPQAGVILSVEIGVGYVLLIAADFSMDVVLRDYRTNPLSDESDKTLALVVTMLQRAYAHFDHKKQRVLGIAVGVAGLVHSDSGTLLFAPNMNWQDVAIKAILSEHFVSPIYVLNEANLAAIGEAYRYEGTDNILLYVSSGVGVGGGIVLKGELLEGISGHAGEIGHMTIQPDGQPCHCGNRGCWETVASQQALFSYIRDCIDSGNSSLLKSHSLDQLTVSDVVNAADLKDRVALDALVQVGQWLGVGIANLINIINPHQVVLGGPLAEAHRYLLPIIRETVASRAFPRIRDAVEIDVSAYLHDAAAVGGAAMIHKRILDHPVEWLNTDDPA